MKSIFVLMALVVLQSCGNKKEETSLDNAVVSEIEDVQLASNKKIPSYNFEELTSLLTKDTDTTYVINFWATWCKPCIKELPYFEKLNEVYSEEKVKVILVSLDFPSKLEKQVIPFIEKHHLKSEVVLLNDDDANSWIPKVSETWSGAIPATIIYKKDNRKFYERSFTYAELETELKMML